jgi:hypothetical protein
MRRPEAAPLLTHEDDESALHVRDAGAGLQIEVIRPGLKVPYRITLARDEARGFALEVLEALDSPKRFADIPGPTEGPIGIHAMIAPEDDQEMLMLMLVRGGSKGDEMETEFVKFASRDQMAGFLDDLVRAAGGSA